jgi:hypothetical protein
MADDRADTPAVMAKGPDPKPELTAPAQQKSNQHLSKLFASMIATTVVPIS